MAERSFLQRLDHAGPLTWLLLGGAGWAVLLWGATLLGLGGRLDEARPVGADAPLPQPASAAPDRVGPLSQYAEAASRPLFTQDRRPRAFIATMPDAEGAQQSQSLDFVLTGVLISPQVQLATLQPNGGGESQRVRLGRTPEGAPGWRLVEVQPRRAIFEGPGGQATLELRSFGEAGMPVAATDAPMPPRDGEGDRALPNAAPVIVAPPAQPQAADTQRDQEARIEEIRKRIEARRAQLRARQGQSPNQSQSQSQSPNQGQSPNQSQWPSISRRPARGESPARSRDNAQRLPPPTRPRP